MLENAAKSLVSEHPMKPFNICIIRPRGYLWSSAFLELAELIAHSLEELFHPVSIKENYLNPLGRNILLGCHLLDVSFAMKIPLDTIIFNTEKVGAEPDVWNQRVLHYAKNFETWDYSNWNLEKFKILGIPSPKLFRFGYHQKLNRIPKNTPKDIDILFYGSMNGPREKILNELAKRGLKVIHLFGKFGAERDSFIARSKVVLNLHQQNIKDFEIIRVHYLMNNQKAIISQFDFDTRIDEAYKDGLMLAHYDGIVSTCIEAARSDEVIREYENRSLQAIKQFDAREIIKDLLF